TVVKVAWSPVAPVLAESASRSVWVWDAPAAIRVAPQGRVLPGSQTNILEPLHRFTGFRTTVEGLSFSPDGKLLGAAARDGRTRLWETASGRERADVDWKGGKVKDVAFSPDGSTIAAACSKSIVVWDVD